MLDIMFDILKNPGEKIMIYHDRVRTSGVMLIQEILKQNGILDEYTEPTDFSICGMCRDLLKNHGEKQDHEFTPCRFVIAHSDIDRSTMNKSLEKFNSVENTYGDQFRILIGSKIIKEAYDFKSIQHLIIASLPVNIPTFLQVIGRSVRKNSHIDLPLESRNVAIYILCTTTNTKLPFDDEISPEMRRYLIKLGDYITIQTIEREINANAMDGSINRDIIMPIEDTTEKLGNLYFQPVHKLPTTYTTSTWFAHQHYIEEIAHITYIIKRLYTLSPVYTWDQLWAKVRQPPVRMEVNPELFNEECFVIAMKFLVVDGNETSILTRATAADASISNDHIIESTLGTSNIIYAGSNVGNRIVHIGKYYILFPLNVPSYSELNATWEYRRQIRDREKRQVVELSENKAAPIVDVEMYMRTNIPRSGITMSVNTYIVESKLKSNFNIQRAEFYKNAASLTDIECLMYLTRLPAGFQISLLEEAIQSPLSIDSVRMISIYSRLDAVVRFSEVVKYADVVKLYKNGLPDLLPDDPCGYTAVGVVKLYTVDGWIETSLSSMNRQNIYKENEIVIGYLETTADRAKFKLRQPIQKMEKYGDNRRVEKGAVCGTSNKSGLIETAKKLGLNTKLKVKDLCKEVKKSLITSELKARKTKSRYKYFYGWWDDMPNI
jgi:hypothetical protein